MFSLKLFIFLFILQKAVSSPYYIISDLLNELDSSESMETEETTSGPNYSDLCPDQEQSSISRSDIKYFVEDIATKLELQDEFVNSYYPEAEEIRVKHLEKLEDFIEQLEDRPKHILHILEDMESLRHKLEPEVQEIAAKLQEFDIHDEKYIDIAERSDTLLKQIEKNKKICQINCEDTNMEPRFKHTKNSNYVILTNYVINNDRTCIKLKDLTKYITARLSQFKEEYTKILLSEIIERDEIYEQKLSDLKIYLKSAAVKLFGTTMYDILSLQDDYHHFVYVLNNFNNASLLDKIQENSAEIKLRLVSLNHDVKKYQQYCMSCNSDRRVKRNIRGYWDMDREQYPDNDVDSIDDLINIKIDEIKAIIESNVTAMFEKLDEDFNEDVIDSYVTNLQPIQGDIEYAIQMEQEALYELQTNVPESSIAEILNLSLAATEMILTLEAAKQYINQYI